MTLNHKRAIRLFTFALALSLLNAIQVRMLAEGRIVPLLGTNAAISTIMFFNVQGISRAETAAELVCYVTGALIGGSVGIWASR